MAEASSELPRIPWSIVVLAGSLTALAPMSVDMYLPALPAIQRALHSSPGAARATLGSFLIGLAIGQFLYGPLSDRIGRRGPLLAGTALYVAASIACAFTSSIELMIAARFVQALGGSAGQVLARASLRDRFDHRTAARALSTLMLVMGVAPIVAPLAGGWMVGLGWPVIFVFQGLVAAAVGAWAFFQFAETHTAERAAVARGESVWTSYLTLLRKPQLIGYIGAGAFNGGAIFAYISASPSLLIEMYKISPANFGWVFGLNATGMIAMSQWNAHLLRRHTPEAILTRSRLASIVFAAVLLADALTGFGGMWGVLAPLFFVVGSFGLVGPNTQAAALNIDLDRTGAISSLMGAATFAVGAAMTVVTGLFHDGTPRPLAAIILAAILASSAALYGLARPQRTRDGD